MGILELCIASAHGKLSLYIPVSRIALYSIFYVLIANILATIFRYAPDYVPGEADILEI